MGDWLWAIGDWILGYWLLGWSVRLYHKLSPCPAGRNLINLEPSRPPYKGGGLGSPK